MNLRLPALLCLAFCSLAHAEGERLTYTCDDGTRFEVAFSADNDGRPQASLGFAGREIILPQVVAASGASYRSGDVALHTKEEKALFSDGKSRLRSCIVADSAAATDRPAAPSAFVDIGGSVTWQATSPLPPDAVLIIRVQDTARADAPALTLADQRLDPGGRQVPIPFRLTIDRDLIGKNAQITIAARIERKGKLLFISDSIHRAFSDGQPRQVDIKLVPVGGAKAP
ncbi:MAG: YbaY family lipoprotein [Azonexus sp.]|nr:YbaY family lipoprotein [Azonexus sp.]